MIDIPSPNKKIIEKYLKKWDDMENNRQDEHYIWEDRSLYKLFHEDYKRNTDLNEILIKCSCLNDFYSTNIFSIYDVAKHIYKLNIDNRLNQIDPTLVNDIANVKIKGIEKTFYSFASKYCCHHNYDFPIYDYFVDRMLIYFKGKDKFAKFTREDLRDYTKFRNVLLEFRKYYDLEEYSLRDIDKYLWLCGKEHFNRKYYN